MESERNYKAFIKCLFLIILCGIVANIELIYYRQGKECHHMSHAAGILPDHFMTQNHANSSEN